MAIVGTHSVATKDRDSLVESARALLQRLQDGLTTPSVYDTSWVARIPDTKDSSKPMFPQTIKWIKSQQLVDGSWGSSYIEYYHDRVISTLSAIVALKTWDQAPSQIERGIAYLRKNFNKVQQESYSTVGFEVIFPSLMITAEKLGLDLPFEDAIIQTIIKAMHSKLQRIPVEMIYKFPTTILHSLEGLGEYIDCTRVLGQQSPNGSFLNSPSSTAFVYMHTGDKKALAYIKKLLNLFDGAVPVNYPLDIFERLWVLDNIYNLRLEKDFPEEVDLLLDDIRLEWTPKGIPWSRYVHTPDIDDTAVAFKLLRLSGDQMYSGVFEYFYDEKAKSFFCFPGELDPSPSHIVHLLETAQYSFGDNEAIMAAAEEYSRNFLKKRIETGDYSDKWLISPSLEMMYKYAVNSRRFYMAPLLERKQQLEVIQARIDENHWIDKTLYYMLNVDSRIFVDIAQIDYQELTENYRHEAAIMHQWADENIAIPTKRALPVFFIGYNMLPEPDQQAARTMFYKSSLWLSAVDDLFDGDDLSFKEIQALTHAFITKEMVYLNAIHDPDTYRIAMNLLLILNQIVAEVVTIQGIEIVEHLNMVIKRNLEANLNEAKRRINAKTATMDDYLPEASITVGAEFVITFTLFALKDFEPDIMYEPEFADVMNLAAEIIRLLNDVRSYEKEIQEGKVNSVGILMTQDGLDKDAAADKIFSLYESKMKQLQKLYLGSQDTPPLYKGMVFDLCRTTAWFYAGSDFEDYLASLMKP